MKSDITELNTIRQYLLVHTTNEEELEKIETRMMSDASFQAEVERVETELIEEYLDRRLDTGNIDRFEKYFLAAPQRQAKFRFVLALREEAGEHAAKKARASAAGNRNTTQSSRGVFMNDLFASGVFRLVMAGLLVAVVGGGLFWNLSSKGKVIEGLTALRSAYRDQRPTMARLSELEYAPLINTRGGSSAPADMVARNKAGLLLISAAEDTPSANSYRALGIYYASQSEFATALEQFDKGAAFTPVNAQFYADHGAVLLETAKSFPGDQGEKRVRYLENALVKLDTALKMDAGYLPALFNRALCLQELNSNAAAREAWQKYLQKDTSSQWAKEAGDFLKVLDEKNAGAKTPAQVLNDFLLAYDRGDPEEAWKIAGESKEMVTGTMISEQLARGFLSADAQGAPNDAKHMLSALNFLGRLEKEKTGDNFFSELADYYSNTGPDERAILTQAQTLTSEAYELCLKSKHSKALGKFVESRKLFSQARNTLEAAKTDCWISFCKADSLPEESLKNSDSLADYSRKKGYKWLLEQALLQSASTSIRQSGFSPAIRINKEALDLARDISDTYGRQKANAQLADVYAQLNETGPALGFSQKSLRENGTYYNSARQQWRNYMFAAEVSRRFGLGESAVAYAMEGVRLSREEVKDPAILHNSFLLLSSAYRATKDYSDSLTTADESLRIGSALDDLPMQKRMVANSLLQQAEAQRSLHNCPQAVTGYARATQLFTEQSAADTLKNYLAQKGKLLCHGELGQDEQIEDSLLSVLALAERLRGKIEEEESRTSFFSDEQSIYEFAAGHALKKGQSDIAFDYIEKGKARSLLDDLSKGNTNPIAGPAVTSVLPLAEIRRRLPAGSQLVQYAVLPDKLLIWVVTDSQVYSIEKNISSADLEKQVRDFTETTSHVTTDGGKAADLSAKLYSLLIQPVETLLNKEKTVVIIPDKILCYLPFEALGPDAGNYVIKNYRIAYSPSATLFVLLSEIAESRAGNTGENFVGVGNPSFDRAENPGLRDLPAAEREIRASAAFYQTRKTIIGDDAVKRNIMDSLPAADVFHFAGHFTTNELSPQYSKFLLAGPSSGEENYLTSAEIRSLKLPKTRLVVLSACKTALENYYHGEGAVGVSRTFFAAGVPAVVASRWEIDSVASAVLMTAFHRNRKEKGLSIAAALRAAQLEMLSDERFNAPFYWAAFAAIGGLEKA
ncbi:MAG TPA: CHAT domain-containing protein [Pyrinomonadaceae bacterium]|jgi:CHAT domain-containing protein|nr:CHAT domain-containing protein [Pyrinomonadaceae bacterium]